MKSDSFDHLQSAGAVGHVEQPTVRSLSPLAVAVGLPRLVAEENKKRAAQRRTLEGYLLSEDVRNDVIRPEMTF